MYGALRFVAALVVSLIIVGVCGTVSSPFSDIVGIDCGIFRTVGDAWYQGLVPYRDIFDSKGPYIYLIQMVARCMSPEKWSVYVLESVNLAICICLLYAIGRTLGLRPLRIYVAMACYLAFFAITIDFGNTVEEWCMPFVLWSMWLCFKYLCSDSDAHPVLYAFVYGLCFGIIALIRINNAAIIVGIVLSLAAMWVWQRRWRLLALNAAYAALGVLVAVLPPVLYFAWHHALYDMLYATFVYNFYYRQVWGTGSDFRIVVNALRMICCATAIISALVYDRRRSTHLSLAVVLMAVITFFTFLSGATYPHYFIMVAPFVFLTAALCVCLRWWWQLAFGVIITFALFRDWELQCRIARVLSQGEDIRISPTADSLLTQHFSEIPRSEYDSIYMLNLFYTYLEMLRPYGAVPAGKYFIQQQSVYEVDGYAASDMLKSFSQARPLWIVSGVRLDDSVLSDFAPKYQLVDSCSTSTSWYTNYLYRRLDP